MQMQLEQLRPPTEAEMIAFAISFLSARGYYVWRQQNTGFFDGEYAAKTLHELVTERGTRLKKWEVEQALRKCWRKVPDTLRGVADVIGWNCTTGKWVAVEVKTENDRLSDHQRQWLSTLKESGGEVYICRGMEEFVNSWERRNKV
jgi:hypothetical protein